MIEKAFEDYVSSYDLSNPDIKLKYNHSFRVMSLQEKYAKLLGFSEGDIYLAKIIGLLHDIGRFEQLKVYHTYSDSKSIDHALYGVNVLFDNNIIEKFDIDVEFYPIIKFAILNHNKLEIEDCDDERMLKHAKLIRDTDKIDILYLLGVLGELDMIGTDDIISSSVEHNFFKHEPISYNLVNNTNDKNLIYFDYVFDINNDICLNEVMENVKAFYERVECNNIFEKYYDEVIKYCKERINNYDRNGNKI